MIVKIIQEKGRRERDMIQEKRLVKRILNEHKNSIREEDIIGLTGWYHKDTTKIIPSALKYGLIRPYYKVTDVEALSVVIIEGGAYYE